MRALLLAAGYGKRLRPITNNVPKCLVPINGKPLIDYWLEQLIDSGIERMLINTHYLHYLVEQHIRESKFSAFVDLVYEKELLLTAGTVLANRSYFNDDPFMLVHADNLCICNFSAFIEAHINKRPSVQITMMTFRTDYPESCGIVELDGASIVQKFHEKITDPPSNLANGAVYIIEPSVIKFISSLERKKVDFSTEVLPNYMGRISSFYNENYHRDIGDKMSYERAQLEIKNIKVC